MAAEPEKKKEGEEPKEPAVGYVHTTDFPDLLRAQNISLMVTTYQAQRILTFSPNNQKLFMLMRIFERPTGLTIQGPRMALCAKNQVWIFESAGEIRDQEGNVQPYDVCYTPRKSYVTGDIAGHEMAFIDDELHVINTRFSCICTLSEQYSFTPVWKPPFISAIAPEDRCHLNGFAIDPSGIRFVSALAETDTKEAWREHKQSGGILMDKNSGEIVTRGLSMPHSPRIYGGALWILYSGIGEVQIVDIKSGNRTSVIRLPGFLRGLTFHGPFAFVGLSKIREKKTFGDLKIETLYPELECAIYCIDIRNGQIRGFIRFTKGIEELFDVKILEGSQKPHVIGFEEETVSGLFVLPPGTV